MPKLPALASIRKSRFLTQEQLAERAKVARSTIAELELQDRPARFATMRKLADALGVEMLDLVRDDPAA
jgi:transcriptional regulator with XRE-family HTH domain